MEFRRSRGAEGRLTFCALFYLNFEQEICEEKREICIRFLETDSTDGGEKDG